MKKTGLFKIIMFILIGMTVATWIFSASMYQEGNLAELGMLNVGFFDFFSLLFRSFSFTYFVQIFILLISIGALYGVLEKTGKYRAWIEKIVKNLKGRKLLFLILSSFVIALLTSVFDYGIILFIFFPLIISIVLAMGYDKVTACLTTFGALLVGVIGSTTGYNTSGVVAEILSVKVATAIYYKLALLGFSYAVLLFFLSKAKISSKVEDDQFAGEKISNKYSVASIIVVLSILFVFLVIGCTKWQKVFNVDAFSKLHETVTTYSPKLPYAHVTTDGIDSGKQEVAIFAKILGQGNALGEWQYAEMAILCFFASLLLGWLYRIKNIFACMYEGAKKMLKPALMVLFTYTVVYFAGNQMFYPTIAKLLLGITNKFSVFFGSITMFLGSFFHVDMLYVANYVVPQVAASGASNSLTVLLAQGIYGVTMFIAPTSYLLVLGLTYLEIPYKEWVKRTWKLCLALLVIVEIVLVLVRYL